ncbi:MAG: hypothetical protein K5873_08330, partial [Treponema sp.]|nr:hypothetical protein [Treponema sp.]
AELETMSQGLKIEQTTEMTGVYTNNNGIITAKGKEVTTIKDESETKTEIGEFDHGTAFYDGTSLYFAEKLTQTSTLPKIKS